MTQKAAMITRSSKPLLSLLTSNVRMKAPVELYGNINTYHIQNMVWPPGPFDIQMLLKEFNKP